MIICLFFGKVGAKELKRDSNIFNEPFDSREKVSKILIVCSFITEKRKNYILFLNIVIAVTLPPGVS